MSSLSLIAKKLKTTKKVHNLFPIYEKYLKKFRNTKINLLEIGFTKNSLILSILIFCTSFDKMFVLPTKGISPG